MSLSTVIPPASIVLLAVTFSDMSHSGCVSVCCVTFSLAVRICEDKLDIVKELLKASPQVYKQHRKVGLLYLFVCSFVYFTIAVD